MSANNAANDSTGEIRLFFNTIFPDLMGLWLLIWCWPSKTSYWVQVVTEETLTMVQELNRTQDVYVGCGLAPQNYGRLARCKEANIAAIPGLWLDVDYGPDHKKANLPPTQDDALSLIEAMGPPPTMLIHSGHGLHAWWAFKELWVFDSEAERHRAQGLTQAWNRTLIAKAKKKGWTADNVGDLARVMRIPGTWNRKKARKEAHGSPN